MSAHRTLIDDPFDVVAARASLQPALDQLRKRASELAGDKEWGTTSLNPTFWRFQIHGDVLEQFQTVLTAPVDTFQSMLVLAVTRYVFEASIWLRLLHKDPRYGLVFYRELLETQLNYWERLEAQANREIKLLNHWSETEKALTEQRLTDLHSIEGKQAQLEAAAKLGPEVMREIDTEAARAFSMFAGEARKNGYGFQAYLVGQKIVPSARESAERLRNDIATFDSTAPQDVKRLWRQCKKGRSWNWRQTAEEAGMVDDYDFIYSYTSRLLHATPSSLTTEHRTLRPDEVTVMQRYIRVRVADALKLANMVLAETSEPN